MSEVSGTDDVGVLIASELSDVSEEQDGQENYIMDLVIDGTTAVVTFFVTDDTAVADVVVAIYDESEEQMLASGTVSVSGEDSSCSIGIEGELPAYFIAKAYLLDAETHEALCTEFESLMYTEEMQGLLEKSTDDFDERLVLNLDDDSSTNYLVFSESTFIFEEESGINEITDYGDGTYTVENADDIFCALNVGDVFAYQYSDRNVLLVKVTSVTVEGSTVYLTEDTDTELSDVFEYAKIESDSEGSSMTVDDDNLEAGVSYLGKTYEYTESEAGISTVDLDMSGNFTHAVSFGINKELQSQDKSAAAGINGTLGLSLAVNVRLYLTQSYQYTQVAVDYKMGFSGSFDGELTLAEIALGEIQLMVLPTVIIGVVPQFVVQFSGSLSFNAELQGKVGISYDSDTGFVNLCTKPSLSSSVIFDGNVYIGIKLPGYAAFLNRKIAMVEIEPYTGVELDVTYTYAESSAASEDYPSEIHTCEACYCGSMYVKVGCSGKVSFFRDWICGEMTFAELTGKLNDFYYSVDHDELGYNSTCPYIGYRCTVTVVDEYDDPISDAVISGTGLEETLITDENGTVIFYLSNGSYTLTAEGANSSGSKTITVKNNIKKVTIRMLEEETEEETEETEEIEPAEGTCGENLTWYLDAEGTLTISGTGDMYTYTYYDNADSECAPWTYMYTGIAIRSIVIEEGVTSIGDYAFKYGGGWNGDSWDDGYSASVSRSYSLTSVSIPDTVVQIGDSAFSDCRGLTEISIPASVTSIGDYAFSYNTSLTSLVIPDGVTSIGERAFSFCGNLQSVTVPASVTDMGEGIFAYCYDLTDVVLKDGITSLSEYIFYYCKSLETITIPDSVTYIGESAFELCKSLNDVTLSSGLTRLEYHVFAWCTGLTSIVIPYGVTEIDIAFVECTSLSNVTLPDSVISMDSAFEHCTSLSSITLPDSVTSIDGAFRYCTSLSSITLSDNVTSIDYAFEYCTSLSSITLPDSVISMDSAFECCTSLSGITLPDSVTNIDHAFIGCTSLSSITLPDSVTSIYNAFGGCTSLSSITLPDSVTNMYYAFYGCTSLSSITLPDSVTNIEYAFYGCTSLSSITLPGSVTSTKYAFYGCTSLTGITISDGITSIDKYMFTGCESLTRVTIPDSVTSIGERAFANCTGLMDITISKSSIGYAAFSGCTSLLSFTIPSVQTINGMVFAGCTNLVWVRIPVSVSKIKYSAFQDCTSLMNVYYDGSSEDWDNITIEEDNTCLTEAAIYFASSSSDEDAEEAAQEIRLASEETELSSTPDSALEPGTEDQDETDVLDESELETESLTDAETGAETDNAAQSDTVSGVDTGAQTDIQTNTESESETEAETAAGSALDEIEITLDLSEETSFIEPQTGDTEDVILADDASGLSGTAAEEEDSADEATAAEAGLTSNSATKTMMAYGTDYAYLEEEEGMLTVTYVDLVPYETYVFLMVNEMNEDTLLSADNLLYIAQGTTDSYGSVCFTCVSGDSLADAEIYVFGASIWSLEDAEVTLEEEFLEYTGKALKPLVSVYTWDGELEENIDFTVGYSNNVQIGTATVTVKGIGDYSGTVEMYFEIGKASQNVTASVNKSSIETGETTQITATGIGDITYTSGDPAIATVISDGLVTGQAEGEVEITVTAAGNNYYSEGSTTITIVVTSDSITDKDEDSDDNNDSGSSENDNNNPDTTENVESDDDGTDSVVRSDSETEEDTSSGTSQNDTETVSGGTSDKGAMETESDSSSNSEEESGTDASVDASNYAGSGTDDYSDEETTTVGAILSLTNTSSGITIHWNENRGATGYIIFRKTKSAKKYTKIKTIANGSKTSYTDTKVKSKNGTTYIYKVVPCYGSTVGTGTPKTTVRLVSVKLSSVKSSTAKKATVKWKKTKKVTGYQIQYSTSKVFKSGTKTVRVSGAKKVSRVLSKLKSGKTYYVRVRTYKKVNGVTYYSAWSSKKSVKVK